MLHGGYLTSFIYVMVAFAKKILHIHLSSRSGDGDDGVFERWKVPISCFVL